MELSKEQIIKINSLAPNEWQENEQGIFTQPFGIPDNIKGLVIYMRWSTGGVSGGSCWDSSNPQYYSNPNGRPAFEVLDLVLKELKPDISYLQFKEIEKLVQSSEKIDWEYYGNRTDFKIEFIVLDELLKKLNSL